MFFVFVYVWLSLTTSHWGSFFNASFSWAILACYETFDYFIFLKWAFWFFVRTELWRWQHRSLNVIASDSHANWPFSWLNIVIWVIGTRNVAVLFLLLYPLECGRTHLPLWRRCTGLHALHLLLVGQLFSLLCYILLHLLHLRRGWPYYSLAFVGTWHPLRNSLLTGLFIYAWGWSTTLLLH